MNSLENFQKEGQFVGESKSDTVLLNQMALEAKSYLYGFNWCPPIKNIYLAFGVGGIIGLFFVELMDAIKGKDQCLWVIVGDIPSAYLVADIEVPSQVLDQYIVMMESWIKAVKHGRSLEDDFSINASPTLENAESLKSRIEFIKVNIIPKIRKS